MGLGVQDRVPAHARVRGPDQLTSKMVIVTKPGLLAFPSLSTAWNVNESVPLNALLRRE